ncbi:Ig-like domain-containing protein [Conexibacter sp. JD483]|uniref:Ig-like domain-containing protein n=1 Tax=unclassified Conexibacter TaxID=2627773 RepID=UPI00271F5F27|nr:MULTISPECIES: Ig-like domain-containing protein [unclassified Conexibacter]MDO8185556.1 Ig-like domain-containing protein [Conexibacter sp. CPCC 205706]MDO8197257.1 Ig-like domain-containing protein [Conexibacter sp. CPCC 205762]MDR9371538.1 Ig-like domain-containing protein [Conexibacter sp. JD483]
MTSLRSRLGVLLALLGVAVLAALALLAPAAARADVPPVPDCMYYVAGCNPIYGTGVQVGAGQIVEYGATVRLDSGLEAPIPWDQPIIPSCRGSIGQTCIYWSIAWKIQPTLSGGNPAAVQSGCGGSDPSCTVVYSPHGIGDGGDVWQPIVAALQSGQTPTRKVGWLLYVRPKWRWVTVTAPGARGYSPLYMYAVRRGTTPTFGACVDSSRIFDTTATAGVDCVRVSGSGGDARYDPYWRLPLPAGSGSWHLYPGPYPRGEAGPATVAGQRFSGADVNLANSDIEGTTSPLPTGTLDVAIDPGGSQLGLGAAYARTVTVTARAVGGVAPLRSVRWYLSVLNRTGSATMIGSENAPPDAVLMPGESIRATAVIAGVGLGTDTLMSRVEASDSKGNLLYGTAPPVSVTVVRDPPPPPGGGGGDGRPRAPIPVAAAGAIAPAVRGRVEDQVRTTYTVDWYAAASCGASDGEARLLGTRTVTTDGVGVGDASLSPPALAPLPGEAVFGYATLGGVRSDRSACIGARAVPTVALNVPASVAAGASAGATVSVNAVGAVASGVVHLREGATELASAPLLAGSATLALPTTLAPGAHSFEAVYDGDPLVQPARSAAATMTVTSPPASPGRRAASPGRSSAGRGGTATAPRIAVRAGRARAGRPFTLTVTVGGGRGGTVALRRNGRTLVRASRLSRRGTAALRLRLPRGRHRLTLVYQPPRPAKPTTKTITLTVAS